MKHGTTWAFKRHKCRCDRCRDAMFDWDRQYREANRDQLRAYYASWMAAGGREKKVASDRAWRASNAGRKAALGHAYWGSHGDFLAKDTKARRARKHEHTSSVARRSGLPWTPEDDAAARRTDLTVEQIAYLLSRSFYAVSGRRAILRKRAEASAR